MENVFCPGFKAAGVAAGLKKNGHKDLGLIYSEVPATVAGVFTRNRVQAAPVVLDRQRIGQGGCRAVIVNSGNANCCTGEQGMQDALTMSRLAAAGLDVPETQVLVASTGVIGEPLPIEKIEAAAAGLVACLKPEGIPDFAEAIMTTDTVAKAIVRQGRIGDATFTVAGTAKGSGMIRPDMATMLCFLMTDISAPADILQEMLVAGANRSLNRITIDGDTSTNDTALLMANGLSKVSVDSAGDRKQFQAVLDDVMITLAKLLVKDAEGATKLVEINVQGAASDDDADRIADTVSHSPLVKTALFGEDANWGRILAAAGRAGVAFDPQNLDIFIGDVKMVQNGLGCGKEAEAQATKILKTDEYAITIDLNAGSGKTSMFTCDYSIDYIKINADYRS